MSRIADADRDTLQATIDQLVARVTKLEMALLEIALCGDLGVAQDMALAAVALEQDK